MYVVGGALDVVLRDAVLTSKVLLFTLHMASGMLFFAWMRRLSVAPVAAALGAAIYAGSFSHLHLFLFRGVFPQAFTIVFLELLFFAADGLFRDRGRRWVNMLILSFATGGMILNHQPHALFAAAYLALFGVIALASGFWNWRRLAWVVLAGGAGGVMSAIAVLPVIVEADWVMIEPESGFFRLQLPGADAAAASAGLAQHEDHLGCGLLGISGAWRDHLRRDRHRRVVCRAAAHRPARPGSIRARMPGRVLFPVEPGGSRRPVPAVLPDGTGRHRHRLADRQRTAVQRRAAGRNRRHRRRPGQHLRCSRSHAPTRTSCSTRDATWKRPRRINGWWRSRSIHPESSTP